MVLYYTVYGRRGERLAVRVSCHARAVRLLQLFNSDISWRHAPIGQHMIVAVIVTCFIVRVSLRVSQEGKYESECIALYIYSTSDRVRRMCVLFMNMYIQVFTYVHL